MAELNQIKCQDSKGGNTGIPDCFFTPEHIVGIILTPPNYKVAKADLSDLQATLKESTLAGPAARIYPLINFVALDADNTEDPTRQTFGYGASLIVRDGNYQLSYQYTDGGLCLHKQLRMFNGKKWGAYLVDANGVIIGYKNGDDLQAIPLMEFYAAPWRVADGSNVSKFTVSIQFQPQYANEFVGFVETKDEFDIATTIRGLINLVVKEVTAISAAGLVKVQVITSCGGANLYDLYKTNLANAEAWLAVNQATGAEITVSTVVANDADKSFSITLDTAGASYPAAGGKIGLSLAAPADLAAAPVSMDGYESNTLTETAA